MSRRAKFVYDGAGGIELPMLRSEAPPAEFARQLDLGLTKRTLRISKGLIMFVTGAAWQFDIAIAIQAMKKNEWRYENDFRGQMHPPPAMVSRLLLSGRQAREHLPLRGRIRNPPLSLAAHSNPCWN